MVRVEGVTRSPVFSHVSATMAGLNTVRACGAQEMLRDQFDDKQDAHTAAWLVYIHMYKFIILRIGNLQTSAYIPTTRG